MFFKAKFHSLLETLEMSCSNQIEHVNSVPHPAPLSEQDRSASRNKHTYHVDLSNSQALTPSSYPWVPASPVSGTWTEELPRLHPHTSC